MPGRRKAWTAAAATFAVFAAAYLLAAAAYFPVHRFPMVVPADLTSASSASTASWSDLLLGKAGGPQVPGELTGRQFRPLLGVSYRIDDWFVAPVGSGHRWIDFAVLAAVAALGFWLVQYLLGPLSRLEQLVAGALCASFAASFAASESGVISSWRADALLALFYVGLAGALVMLLPPPGTTPRKVRWRAAPFALMAITLVGASVAKESGPLIAVAAVCFWCLATLLVDRQHRRLALYPLLTVFVGAVAFYGYKIGSGGTNEILLPTERLHTAVADAGWGHAWIDHALRRLAHSGVNQGYVPSNVLRNFIATVFPVFAGQGELILRRLPFLLPFAVFLYLFARSLWARETRRLLLLLAAVTAIAAGSGLFSLRPRLIEPGYAVWVMALAVCAVLALRRRLAPPALVAIAALALVVVSLALAYNQAVRYAAIQYDILYTPSTAVNDPTHFAQLLDTQRNRYGCGLLADFKRLYSGKSWLERTTEVVSGTPATKSPVSPQALADVERHCAG